MLIVTEIRAAEVILGARNMLKKLILNEPEPSPSNNTLQRLIRMMIQYAPNEDGRKIIEDRVAVYNIRTNNRLEFVKGRVETAEVDRSNSMILALGGYFCVAKRVPTGSHNEDQELTGRCTKISGLHKLAAIGQASLPGGIPSRNDETLLPMPLREFRPNIPDVDLKRLFPIALFKTREL